jgi:polyhydroxyalkanoate synthesis regulator protein
MQAFLPSYLELSLASFAKQQEQLRQQFQALGQGAGLPGYEEQIRQNMQLFDRAMKMFSPFSYAKPDEPPPAAAAAPKAEPAPPAGDDALAELRKRMEEMQAQIEKLAKR